MASAGCATLHYLSTHGTGTPLGDPIESGAAIKAISAERAAVPTPGSSGVLSFGGVKTLTGHLEGTAGLAGLLLAVQQLRFAVAPALRYRSLNQYVASSIASPHMAARLPIQVEALLAVRSEANPGEAMCL